MSEFAGNGAGLAQLCALFGIATAYHDIWGHRIGIAEENLIALLAQFGIDASRPERISAAFAEAQCASWRDALPPVAAFPAGAAQWALAVRQPETTERLSWTVTEENGRRHRGESALAEIQGSPRIDIDGVAMRERRIEFALELPAGYHTLSIEGIAPSTLLIAAPAH